MVLSSAEAQTQGFMHEFAGLHARPVFYEQTHVVPRASASRSSLSVLLQFTEHPCGEADSRKGLLPAHPGLCSTLPLLGKSLGLRLPAHVWQLLHRTWQLMVEYHHISFLVSGTVCGGDSSWTATGSPSSAQGCRHGAFTEQAQPGWTPHWCFCLTRYIPDKGPWRD